MRAWTGCLLAWQLASGVPAPRPAWAGPEGAEVVRGEVSFESLGDKTVIHASDRSIIDYRSFDIGARETVQFIQPGASARVLNRIDAARPTHIDGALIANGRVYLVNRSGVYFGEGAVVNVAELTAAAGHISNEDFLAGIDHFSDLSGAVQNAGSIHADVVKLVGEHVANSGSISAEGGLIAMVAGDDVLLGEPGSRLYVKIASSATGDLAGPGVSQSGTLTAEGGSVMLAGGDLLGLAIAHSGATRADEIVVAGTGSGLVEVSGTLDASDPSPGGVGGHIEVTGERIALRAAQLDASGDAGGGSVLVGGDFQGQGEVRTAVQSFVDPDSRIRADALSQGDGGKVIVWADGATGFYGAIDARGGAAGGDGGLVEVSGKQQLFFRGAVDTRAPAGRTGSLLLDPVDLTVANGSGDGAADGTNTFTGAPSGGVGSVLAADTGPVTIFESELEGLAASTNVVLQATNNLTIQNLSDNLLALPTTGSVSFVAGNAGLFSMDAGDTIRTEGASLTIQAGNTSLGSLNTTGASGTLGGAISVIQLGAMQVGAINAGTGNVTLTSLLGSISDDASAATRITGNNLSLTAGGSIGSTLLPISTTLAGTLSAAAATGAGDIAVSESSGLVVGTINGGTGKNVSLTAETGSITGASATNLISGSTLSLTANDAGAAIGSGTTPIRVAVVGATNASASNGPGGIFMTSVANALRVGAINAGTGNVTLVGATGAGVSAAAGSILDDLNGSTRIVANNLALTAATSGASIGASGIPIGTSLAGTLSVSSPNGTGGIFVSESNGLSVGAVNGGTGKSVSLTAEAGSIADDGVLNTVISGSSLALAANDAGAAIGTSATPMRVTLAGSLNASAANGPGGIFVSETNAMSVGAIDADSGGVTLRAESGAILDDGNAATFIDANSLSLESLRVSLTANGYPILANSGSIGTLATPISTQNVSSLTAASAGAVVVRNTAGGDLSLDGISTTGTSSSSLKASGTQAEPECCIESAVSIRNDAGAIRVNAPISVPATTDPKPTLEKGSIFLDTPYQIEFAVSSLTAGRHLRLNTNIAPGQIAEPLLATLVTAPGTSDLTLTALNGTVSMGEGQTLSVPGTLQINAEAGTPAYTPRTGQIPENLPAPPAAATLGTVTVADVNALDLVINAQRAEIFQRDPRSLYDQNENIVRDGGGDIVANTISLNIDEPMQAIGSGALPTFATASGEPVGNAPTGTRFGVPIGKQALVPADFVGVSGAVAERVLDLRGAASTTEGTPDAVAPVPYAIRRDDGQLSQQNAAAALGGIWGTDLLAYLRCSQAPGDDPDRVSLPCLGYNQAQQSRAPFTSPAAIAARAGYRELRADREALRAGLASAFDAYRAEAAGSPPSGADFRRYLEAHPERADALDTLLRLGELLETCNGMLGRDRGAAGAFEGWQQELLHEFTPSGMTPELLYEATGVSTGRVESA